LSPNQSPLILVTKSDTFQKPIWNGDNFVTYFCAIKKDDMSEHYFRIELQLTQKELAKLLRIDKSAVVHAERGRRSLSKKSNKIIDKFRDAIFTQTLTEESKTKASTLRSEQTATSVAILKKDIEDYKYRLTFNQRAFHGMSEKFENLLQSIEKLHSLQQFPEKFEEVENTWIDLQIRLNEKKLRACSLEKKHQLELRIAEITAGLAKAEEMLRQMEGQ
jgi:transcriptional regulator with XRE-family HTH domain